MYLENKETEHKQTRFMLPLKKTKKLCNKGNVIIVFYSPRRSGGKVCVCVHVHTCAHVYSNNLLSHIWKLIHTF